MFEGKPPRPEDGTALRPGVEGEELRPLAWSELTMRLAVARDLRASLAPGELDGQASFDALSARWIAAHPPDEAAVNREDSANRKGTEATGAEAPPPTSRDLARE